MQDTSIELLLYGAEAQTADNGGLTFASQQVTSSGTEQWLTLTSNQVTLAPNEERIIPFSINVPANMPAGEYVTGIVAQQATGQSVGEGGIQVNFVPRTAVSVLMTVPGELTADLGVRGMQTHMGNGQQTLITELTNLGNVGLKPEGELTLQNRAGGQLYRYPIRLGYVIAGDTLPYQINLVPSLPAGNYQANLTLNYGDNQQLTYDEVLQIAEPQVIPTAVPETAIIGNNPEEKEADTQIIEQIPSWVVFAGMGILLVLAVLLLMIFRLSRQVKAQQSS